MLAGFWIKAVLAFLTVSAFGLLWAYYKHEWGKKGEKVDEFLRWLELFLYFGRWILIAAFAIGMLWWGLKENPKSEIQNPNNSDTSIGKG
jgi:hypothetical protein